MRALRGSWTPAWRALGRMVRAQLTARGSDPAFTDAAGTLSRAELWSAVRGARHQHRSGSTALVVSQEDQRAVVVEALAGLLARRTVVVVAPRAGDRVLRAARAFPTARPGIFFTTSGSTGTAEVVRSRRGLRAAAQMGGLLGRLPARRRPVVASLAPVSGGHGFSTFASTLALGGHFVALGPHPIPQLTGLAHVDILTGIPLQLRELAAAVAAPPTSIGLVLSGSDRLLDAGHIGDALDADVADAYGSTEAGTLTLASPADRRRSPGTVGRPLPGVRIRECGGRLVISSPVLGRGEFDADAGFIRDGLVHVTGRADGITVTGGENIDPQAVQAWLLTRPGVLGASVHRIDDERFGSRLAARVHAGGPIDADALRAGIRAEFGAAATPASVEVSG